MKMKHAMVSLLLSSTLITGNALADNGLIRIKSTHSVATTIDRLETAVNEKGMTVFFRVSHSDGAEKAGLQLRPTELLIFGNPMLGTKLMQCAQSAAIDLPLKAVAYEDENGQVWLSWNDPAYLAERHGAKGCEEVVGKMTKGLQNFAAAATR